MVRRDLVVGLDSSTTAAKAIAWDLNGLPIASARHEHARIRVAQPSWHEQDASDWWIAAAGALRETCAQVDVRRLAAVAISHQRETFVPVDATGRPLRNAIVWMDERSRPLLPILAQACGAERFHRLTGKPLSGNLSIAKLLWLREHEPGVFADAAFFLDTHAFLVHRLTGQFRTGWGSADPMGLFDMERRTWAGDLLSAIGVRPEQVPELCPPGGLLGEVTAEASAACGLPAGLPVICGLGDGQAAGLGANVTGPGQAYLNLGTAVVSGTYGECYLTDRAFRTTCGGVPGTYLFETVLLGGTYTVDWFRQRFGCRGETFAISEDLEGFDGLAAWETAVADLPPGAAGLLLVPYWNSAMNPYWDAGASGIVVGWRGIHDRRHLYRAILEGIAFEQRLHCEGVAVATGRAVEGFVVMGGGSRSPLWRQMIADVTGVPVRRCGTPEASALGAGVLAAAGAGLFPGVRAAAARMSHVEPMVCQPDPRRHETYSRLYQEVYRHLFPALQTYLGRLTELTG